LVFGVLDKKTWEIREEGHTKSESYLADHKVIPAVHADAPDDQADGGQQNGGIGQPQTHLGRLLDVLAVRLGLGQPDDEVVAEGAGAEDLRDERADDEADVQESSFVSSTGTQRI